MNPTEENLQILRQARQREDSLATKQAEAFWAMIPENRDSKALAVIICNHYGGASVDVLEKIVDQFGESVQACYPIQKVKKRIAQVKASAVGSVAPEFELKDLEGNPVKLSSFRGKYVLIDFWASWCGPCRAEIPHLKEAYKEYSNKGVAFFSVSIDKDNAAWRKAMKEENMPWAQVQAPKAGKDVMKQYQFSGIPYILVLDKEGKIVAKNLRGKALTDKLEELLSGKKKSVAMPAMGM